VSERAAAGDRRPWRSDVAAVATELAAYTVTALAMMWPLTFRLGSAVAGSLDARYNVWANWLAGEKLASGDLSVRIPGIVWPYGVDIRHLDGHLPTLIGGLWNLIASPELAHNLGLLTGVALNMWAGRRLAKAFSTDRSVWAITAIAFATAPAIAARLEVHFSLLFVFPVALLVEEAVRIAAGERRLRPVRLGVLLTLAFLCSVYVLVFGAIAFASIVLLASSPRELPRVMLRVVTAIVLALVLLSPFVVARLRLDRAEAAAGHDPALIGWSLRAQADGLSLATQPSTSTLDAPGMDRMRAHFRPNVPESTIFPGYLLLLGLGGLLFLRSTLRWPLLFTAIGTWILALGPGLRIDGRFLLRDVSDGRVAWMPYTWLFELPGLASLRSPNRAGFTLAAVLAAAAASGLAWLFDRYRRPWQRAAMLVGSGALLATNLLIPIDRESIAPSRGVREALLAVAERVGPGESMIQVPADCRPRQWRTVSMQILHRTPLVGCQTSHAAIPWASDLELYKTSSALAALRCTPGRLGRVETPFTRAEAFDRGDVASLRSDFGGRFFLVFLEDMSRPWCEHVREAATLLEGFEVVGGDAGVVVIDTGPIGSAADP
jgi:hypothetical protein